jgi:hypothetical protein
VVTGQMTTTSWLALDWTRILRYGSVSIDGALSLLLGAALLLASAFVITRSPPPGLGTAIPIGASLYWSPRPYPGYGGGSLTLTAIRVWWN